jgi:hypothetical protein
MRLCLGHPTEGYYTKDYTTPDRPADQPKLSAQKQDASSTASSLPQPESTVSLLDEIKKDVFGRKGDFITSPEISQVFGEVSPLLLRSISITGLTGYHPTLENSF